MKTLLAFLMLVLVLSCTQEKSKAVPFSEDYVLIEFASKLEEDYHKFNVENPQNQNLHIQSPSMINEEQNPHHFPGNDREE